MANKLPDSGPISMLNIYDYLQTPDFANSVDYYFPDIEDFNTRRDGILAENNNDLSQKTFGFGNSVVSLKKAFFETNIVKTPNKIYGYNITDVTECFKFCFNLTSVSSNLFNETPNIVILDSCFYYCELLENIPHDLFYNLKNAENFDYVFSNTKISNIPANLFLNNIKAKSFSGTFEYCPCKSIPDSLFSNNLNVKSFSGTFSQSRLSSIPENLFKNNSLVEDFSYCFDTTSIDTIPVSLFYNNIEATTFSHTFSNCDFLLNVGLNLFDKNKNITIIDGCFNWCTEITSLLPDVWNKSKFPNITNGDGYAEECTKAANYNEIPSNFGGPAPEVPLAENTTNATKSLVKSIIRTANIPTSPISLNDKDFRELAGISNGQISLRDFYGKSTELKPQDCDYYFETEDDFWNRIENIIVENNGDFINKTFGFGDSVLSISHGFLYDTRVISTPKMIVANNITKVNSLFEMSGVIKISEKLFDNCKNIEDASLLFSSLENNDAIVELPENLLRNLTELNNLEDAFSGINIVNIPNNFFVNNKKVSTLYTTFSYTNIITIPEDLFVNTNITSVYMCFYTCRKLKTIPQNLFSRNPNINEFISCFEDCSSITSAVPELWKTHPNANGTDCFKGCVNAANYNDIPSSWGGPKDESLILTIDCSQYNDTSVDAVIKSITSNQNHIINVSDLPNKIHTVKFKPGCIFTATMGPSDMPGFGMKLQYEDSSGNKASVGFTSGTVTKTLGPLNNNGYMKFYQQ